MTAHNGQRAGSSRRSRLLRGGLASGAAAAMLSCAAVATAVAQPATPAPPAAHVAVAHAATTPYSTVNVAPGTATAGQQVTITGNGPKNARAGKWITLLSDAFASGHTVNGIPAVRTQVLVNGKYSVKATIRSGLRPTDYAVLGMYNGQGFDDVAWLNVRAPRLDSTISVSSHSVRPGAHVTVTGDAPTNARAGKWITLQSDAFVSQTNVNGIPAIRTQVLVNGKYSVQATIRRGIKPTTYAIAGSFNGKPFSQVAWMKVI
ncbi:MAG TPA: hypothetical protein VMF57_09235 [Solirubrobacteraceae bacterium]|nr:hypothetical protein [Solirubrobacteraceae bacterium]